MVAYYAISLTGIGYPFRSLPPRFTVCGMVNDCQLNFVFIRLASDTQFNLKANLHVVIIHSVVSAPHPFRSHGN